MKRSVTQHACIACCLLTAGRGHETFQDRLELVLHSDELYVLLFDDTRLTADDHVSGAPEIADGVEGQHELRVTHRLPVTRGGAPS